MGNKIYCSTGALIGRENDYNYKYIIKYADQIQADAFELMMLKAYYKNFNIMSKLFAENNIMFPVIHSDKDIGTLLSQRNDNDTEEAIRLFNENCNFGKDIGAKMIVLHLWGGDKSDIYIDYNIKICEKLIDISKKYNLTLVVENIPCLVKDPITHWLKLHNIYPDLKFILDTRFLAFHEQTKRIFELKWFENGNIIHMHISDFTGPPKDFSSLRPILHPNEGIIDFNSLLFNIKKVYNGSITLESPVISKDNLDIEKLNNSLNYIKKAGNQS